MTSDCSNRRDKPKHVAEQFKELQELRQEVRQAELRNKHHSDGDLKIENRE
jgi:hypothetical protein